MMKKMKVYGEIVQTPIESINYRLYENNSKILTKEQIENISY